VVNEHHHGDKARVQIKATTQGMEIPPKCGLRREGGSGGLWLR